MFACAVTQYETEEGASGRPVFAVFPVVAGSGWSDAGAPEGNPGCLLWVEVQVFDTEAEAKEFGLGEQSEWDDFNLDAV